MMTPALEPGWLLTLDQVADRLNYKSTRTVQRLIDSGRLKAVYPAGKGKGPGQPVRVRSEDLLAFMAGLESSAKKEE